MEVVTAVLGDGLHVGILLQGKKVGDDDKTLLQTGISQGDKLHTLGFMLEPRCAQIPPSLCAEDPSVFVHGSTTQHLTRYVLLLIFFKQALVFYCAVSESPFFSSPISIWECGCVNSMTLCQFICC